MTSPHHDDLFLVIGRLEGKVDSLLRMHSGQQEQIVDHEKRLRDIENSKARIIGGSAVVAAVASVAMQHLVRVTS